MPDETKNNVKLLGKRVGIHTYWHYSLSIAQPLAIQALIQQAADIAALAIGRDFNIFKFSLTEPNISLLDYPDFFENPFPALRQSWQVNIPQSIVKYRSYKQSFNPPILHRKELFLANDHPSQTEFRLLTEQAEKLGLFVNSRTIGFRQVWQTLIAEKGYFLEGHQLIPIINRQNICVEESLNSVQAVQRHRTALTRYNLSAPMQALARFGFLDGQKAIFDYGCGKGDDIRNLTTNNIIATGWDPYYAPEAIKQTAPLVNLGFVINVIEDMQERAEALQEAYTLAEELLVVAAMLYNQNSFKGRHYQDGVITGRATFQKYYNQAELKIYIDNTLKVEAIAIGPGIFFVFKDKVAEQRFLLNRQRSQANLLRLTQKPLKETKAAIRDQRLQAKLSLILPLRDRWLSLGRAPQKHELSDLINLVTEFGSMFKALRFVQDYTDSNLLDQARLNRINDLLVYFALYAFSRRQVYSHLDPSLQLDVKAFFISYAQAVEQGRQLLFQLKDTLAIEAACKTAAEQGIGYFDEKQAFYVLSEQVEQLSPLLRIYIGCASQLYGDISQADLLKIHMASAKLSLMSYDDFYGSVLPRLMSRVKIKFKDFEFDYFNYGKDYEPTYLYLKSRYMSTSMIGYQAQKAFDEQLQNLNLFDFSNHGPKPGVFRERLRAARWEIKDETLIRSQTLPNLDEPCGLYFTYRDFIECGETWQKTSVPNIPQQAASYTALYELTTQILEPVIDYFGMIRLTYGFCSATLAKTIKQGIAPALDQHAYHECNRLGKPICKRLGAAVDFIVDEEDMLEVAQWIAKHTSFDRLYFYGKAKPIHVSFGPEQKREWIEMRQSPSGKLYPYKH